MSSDTKVSPYSLNDLKNTTDDALGNYLRGLKFTQNNSKLDFRLAVGYVAVIIAGATFAADYKLGWDATKYWTAAAVAAYTILNGVFTYSLYFLESGLVFEGSREGKKISIASKTKKHDPTYYLTITSFGSNSRQIKAPFTTWFTADGYFVAKPFQQWLASSIDVVGNADTKNAATEEQSLVDGEVNGTPSESLTATGTGTEKVKSSKSKKRKG